MSLGLVVPNFANPFFPLLVQELEIRAKEVGLSILLTDSLDSVAVEAQNLDLLAERRVDAIVISPLHRNKSRPALLAAAQSVPVIQVDRMATASLPFAGVDQARALTRVLDHLAAGGRQRIAYIGADTGESTAAERLGAFRDWAQRQDRPDRYSLTSSSYEGGRAAAARVLARNRDVDAIACCNDAIAVGVLAQLHESGIAVPDQIAVTGFDDTVIATVCQLTTVRQPLDRVAAQAVAWAQRASEVRRDRVLFDARLVVRDSSSGAA
jgi:LacI family transcriptional regulator